MTGDERVSESDHFPHVFILCLTLSLMSFHYSVHYSICLHNSLVQLIKRKIRIASVGFPSATTLVAFRGEESAVARQRCVLALVCTERHVKVTQDPEKNFLPWKNARMLECSQWRPVFSECCTQRESPVPFIIHLDSQPASLVLSTISPDVQHGWQNVRCTYFCL